MIQRRDQPVRLASRTELSPTCFRLEFVTAIPIDPVPGQFAMLSCGDGIDPLLRRPFSLAGVRAHGGGSTVELLVKEVGRGTGLLRRAPIDSELRMLAPLGVGFTLAGSDTGPLALIAGGIGLPPVLFAAETLAVANVHFDLFLGAATRVELLEIERCRVAAARVGGEVVLATDDGSAGEAGFVTAALARRVNAGRRYGGIRACGPNPMLAATALLAREHGLDAELSLEEPMACGAGVCLGCVVELADGAYVPSCKEGPVFSVARLAERWWL